jgi:N utilization substance protein B
MLYKRRITREKVLQALYAYELSQEPITTIVENILGELRKDAQAFEFAKEILYKTIQHQVAVDKKIRAKVDNWEFSRIAIIDRLVLRMGISELMYCPDIPPKVTINEAIEIAKEFSTEKSGKFVNGVLDAILEDMKRDGILVKSGRGLMGMSLPGKKKKDR